MTSELVGQIEFADVNTGSRLAASGGPHFAVAVVVGQEQRLDPALDWSEHEVFSVKFMLGESRGAGCWSAVLNAIVPGAPGVGEALEGAPLFVLAGAHVIARFDRDRRSTGNNHP